MQASQRAESALNISHNQIRLLKSYHVPIWVCDNPDAEAVKPGLIRLVDRVQQQERGSSQSTKSNRGGWRSNTLSIREQGLEGLAAWLTKLLRPIVSPKYAYRLEPWLNIHYQHGFNLRHTHPGAVLSGVYYISVPDGSGSLVVEDPRAEAVFSRFDKYFQYCEHEQLAHGLIGFTPREGRVIMFPSWLPHHVEVSDSTQPRISLPFNLIAKEKPNS
ncbi:TIGR02466 family protein [Cyanobium sp. LEGE 06113]|uniref:TIGR02466 family protein n=1 Tax=Cyanobium sp. LEGE 06113 TaxID=1297573 RepID=UPI00187EE97C|nr:TIGR02466 family protein [Cyanobium sp. LEGE 06113]MBE9154458.1 hypothetical protein [Cyanobium sp. LEGE 06113]